MCLFCTLMFVFSATLVFSNSLEYWGCCWIARTGNRMLTWDYCQWPHYVNKGYFKKYKRCGIYFLGRERERMCVYEWIYTASPPTLHLETTAASLRVVVRVPTASDLYFGDALGVLGSPAHGRQLLFLRKSSSPLSWHIWNRHSLHRHSSGTCSVTASLRSYKSELLWSHSLLRASTSIVVAGKLITLGNWAGREVTLWGKMSLIPCPLPFWRNTARCGQG